MLFIFFLFIKNCLYNSFCYDNYSSENCCCGCDCCNITSCCCFEKITFEQKEISFCIRYQEKRKLKWFNDYISSPIQKELFQVIFIIAYFQSFTIGLEVYYEEKKKKSIKVKIYQFL